MSAFPNGDPLPGVFSLLEQGEHFCATGRLDAAADLFHAVLRVAHCTGNVRLRAVACGNLAVVHRQAGRFDEAAAWQQKSVAATLKVNDIPGSAGADRPEKGSGLLDPSDLVGLANDALGRGDLDLAERLFAISIRIEATHGSLEGIANDVGSLGVTALLRGDRRRALDRLWRAYRLHCRLGDCAGAGRDLLNLAELCRLAGRYRLALRCISRAAVLFDRCGAAHLADRARLMQDDMTRIVGIPPREPLAN